MQEFKQKHYSYETYELYHDIFDDGYSSVDRFMRVA